MGITSFHIVIMQTLSITRLTPRGGGLLVRLTGFLFRRSGRAWGISLP